MKVLVIIPAYNEESNILNTIKSIKKYKDIKFDYIVINDGSTDNTLDVLQKNNINHLSLPFNMGIGAAVQTGYKYAYYNDYDVAVQFDGDGQHDISYLKKVITPIKNKEADMVVGSRYVEDISEFKSTFARQMGIKLISTFIKILTKRKVYDITSGYRAVNRKVLKIFAKIYPQEYPEPITNYSLLKSGYKVKELGVNMYARENGESSIDFFKSIYYVFNVIMSILLFNFKNYGDDLNDI